MFVGEIAHGGRDLLETCHVRRIDAPLAGDALIAAVLLEAPHQDGLQHADRPDGGGELGEFALIELLAAQLLGWGMGKFDPDKVNILQTHDSDSNFSR